MPLFDSKEKLAAWIDLVCKKELGYGEMTNLFLFGNWTDVSQVFWVYPLEYEDGHKEWTIDYSLAGGGGWCNIASPVNEFVRGLDAIMKWDMAEELRIDIELRKQKLLNSLNEG